MSQIRLSSDWRCDWCGVVTPSPTQWPPEDWIKCTYDGLLGPGYGGSKQFCSKECGGDYQKAHTAAINAGRQQMNDAIKAKRAAGVT